MKSDAAAGRRCSTVVSVVLGVVLPLSFVAAEAAIYVDGKRCAGDAYEQPNGSWKCRTADGSVAEGAGYSAEKLKNRQRIREKDLKSSPELPNNIPEMAKPAVAK